MVINHKNSQRGEASWGCLALVFLAAIAWIALSIYNERTEVLNLPNERAWAQNEVQKLKLGDAQKKVFLSDVSAARNAREIQEIVWRSRWEGDPSYRAEKEREAAEREAFDESWLGKITHWGFPAVLALFVWWFVLSYMKNRH